jgi:hypothetical protein
MLKIIPKTDDQILVVKVSGCSELGRTRSVTNSGENNGQDERIT